VGGRGLPATPFTTDPLPCSPKHGSDAGLPNILPMSLDTPKCDSDPLHLKFKANMERKCAGSFNTVLVTWAGHFQF